MDDKDFKEGYKNLESKYSFLKIFEKELQDFKNIADNFISFETLRNKKNLNQFLTILDKVSNLIDKEQNPVDIFVANSVISRPLFNMPFSGEYNSIVLNNNENIVKNILNNGSLNFLNENFNNKHSDEEKKLLDFILGTMKINPDKFSEKDFELITKLYIEMASASLNANYTLLKEKLQFNPKLKNIVDIIKNEEKEFFKNIQELVKNIGNKIEADYILLRQNKEIKNKRDLNMKI